ncbi:glycosyltransferase [Ramlibacter sp.]|uniref:glycosyltransferase n=1 Tax=Ramlibacter sp. TaxID=1917967 RepID=UPI00262C6D20|nr:glycosyltransferase [Ramlibacter sp.]MDB5956230.1 putative glycosyl transferase [Ramlibacter sp.]
MVAAAQAPRCLFQLRKRRGLGHLVRGLNIAKALLALRPEAHVLFHLATPPPPGFWPENIPYEVDQGTPRCSEAELAACWSPQVQVFDTELPDGDELRALQAAAPACALAFLMRRCLPTQQQALYGDPSLAAMDLVLVPHTAAEFGHALPEWLASRSHFVGPVVRRPDPLSQRALEQRLGLRFGDLVLTSTVGSGSVDTPARRLFDTVADAHAALSALPQWRAWRHIVVLGPCFEGQVQALAGMTLLAGEPDLVDLLARSDLVVADGGYTTVSELTLVRTPAVLLPSPRCIDDPLERARRLADLGCCVMLQPDDGAGLARVLASLAGDAHLRERMRERYPPAQVGNKAAARLLLALCEARPGCVAGAPPA